MAKKNNNIHEITIKIEGEEWQKALDESFKKKVKNVTIDGFRKGKCPRDIFEKKYGKETLYIDAAEKIDELVLKNEPYIALVPPSGNGLEMYEKLFKELPSHLKEGGYFMAEFGYQQKDDYRRNSQNRLRHCKYPHGERYALPRLRHGKRRRP